LAVVVVIVAIMATLLLQRVMFYEEQAEKTAMEQMLGTLRSALHLQIADRIVHGQMQQLHALAGDNPMNWLAEKPKNYAGEYYGPASGQVGAGNWYFDMGDHTLVYLVANQNHLKTAPGENNKLRFQSRLLPGLVATPETGKQSVADNSIEGVLLETVIPYKWF
jgi:general secretion pathway protein G